MIKNKNIIRLNTSVFIALVLTWGSLLSPSAHAETNITACHDAFSYGLNILQNDLLYDSELYGNGYCLAFGGSITLDCQGHVIDMNFSESNAIYIPFDSGGYSIIKNCTIKNNIYTTGIFLEYMGNNKVINSTFYNLWQGIVAEFGDNTEILGNYFYNITQEAVNFNGYAGNYAKVIGNTFEDNGYDFRFSTAGSGYSIWNNKFIDGYTKILLDSSTPNNWNSTLLFKTNILNYNKFGGNFWGDCSDLDYNGFCDDPVVIDVNNIDYLPLSNTYNQFYGQIPPIDKMNLISITNKCSGNNLSIISVYGFCVNTTCGSTNLTALQACAYGCSNDACNPSPFVSNIIFFVIIIFIILVILLLAKR